MVWPQTISFSILTSLSLAHSIPDTLALLCLPNGQYHFLPCFCMSCHSAWSIIPPPPSTRPPHFVHMTHSLTGFKSFSNVISLWRPSLASLFNLIPHQYLHTLLYLSSWFIAFLLHQDVRRPRKGKCILFGAVPTAPGTVLTHVRAQ